MEREALPEAPRGQPLLRRPFVGGSAASAGGQSKTPLPSASALEEGGGMYNNSDFLSAAKTVKNQDKSFKELIDSILR
ncbi:MAG: hypothetical protein LBS86_05705 [Treponema sp.]|jgi:hypothetical protein|nr:hypothetical protein [Treponema sp.]